VQKKKIADLRMIEILVLLGGSSLSRLCHARQSNCLSTFIVHSEEALLYSTPGGGMLNGGFRVRAARRREKLKTFFCLLFQRPLHP
jgi:hypothetical protein